MNVFNTPPFFVSFFNTILIRKKRFLSVILILLGSSLNAQTELLSGGNMNPTYWSATGDSYVAPASLACCESCPNYGWTANPSGFPKNNANGTFSQAFTLSANVIDAELSFWYSISTDETSTLTWDFMVVELLNSSGTIIHTFEVFSNLDATEYSATTCATYYEFTENFPNSFLSQSNSQNLQIRFRTSTDNNNSTLFRVEDVSIKEYTCYDQYEPNNSLSDAEELSAIPLGNGIIYFQTQGACLEGNEDDFYLINLPLDCDYDISFYVVDEDDNSVLYTGDIEYKGYSVGSSSTRTSDHTYSNVDGDQDIKFKIEPKNDNSNNAGSYQIVVIAEPLCPDIEVSLASNGAVFPSGQNINISTPLQAGGSYSMTFNIDNVGFDDLEDLDVSENSSQTSIGNQPNNDISNTQTTSFTIDIDPSSTGNHTVTISIESNDPDENPFTFTLNFTVVDAPEIRVLKGGSNVPNGYSLNITDTLGVGYSYNLPFVVQNIGSTNLTISNVTENSSQASENISSTSLSSNTSLALNLSIVPTTAGNHTITLTIYNNDSDENPFIIYINITVIDENIPEDAISGQDNGSVIDLDPINMATGKFQMNILDMSIGGINGDYPFVRYYNSRPIELDYHYHIAEGWTSSFSYNLKFKSDTIIFQKADGSADYFLNTSGTITPLYFKTNDTMYLETLGSNIYILETRAGTKFRFINSLIDKITDKNGNIIQYLRDGSGYINRINIPGGRFYLINQTLGKISSVVDNSGRTIFYNIDVNDDLLSTTGVRNTTTSYTYDTLHEMETMTDPNLNLVIQNFYNSGYCVHQIDANNNHSSISYSLGSQITTTVTYPNGQSKVYYHQKYTKTIDSIQDELGYVEHFEFNDYRNLKKYTNKKGDVYQGLENSVGDITSFTNPLGETVNAIVNNSGLLTASTSSLGHTSRITYDSDDNIDSLILPNNSFGLLNHNTNGQLISSQNLRGVTSTFGYNATGDNNSVTTPTGTATSIQNGYGADTSVTDRNSKTSTVALNNFGAPTTFTDALSNYASLTYDDNGNTLSFTNKKGTLYETIVNVKDLPIIYKIDGNIIKTINYDNMDRFSSSKDAYGVITDSVTYFATGEWKTIYNGIATTTCSRNNNGAITSIIDAEGNTWIYILDKLDRVKEVKNPNGISILKREFDADGNVKNVTNGEGKVTDFTLNNLGLIEQTKDANNGTNDMVYNPDGTLKSLDDAKNQTSTFIRSDDGTADSLITADGNMYTNTYGLEGEHLTSKDANSLEGAFSHNDVYSLISESYSNGSNYNYTHNENQALLTATNNSETTTFERDNIDFLTKVTDPFGQEVQYGYNDNKARTLTVYPQNDSVWITYYPNGLTHRVEDWNGNWMEKIYDNLGREIDILYSNGMHITKSYTPSGYIDNVTVFNTSGVIVYQSNPSYFNTGSLENKNVSHHIGVNFGADLNTTNATFSYTDDDEQLTAGLASKVFDNNGATISETYGAITNTYHHIEKGLTDSVIFEGDTIFNKFNALGKRIAKTKNGTETRYVLDLNNPLDLIIRENDEYNNKKYSNIYFAGELAWRINEITGETVFCAFDVMGNTALLTDTSGAVVQRYEAGPFGAFQNSVGSIFDNPYIFLGKYGIAEEVAGGKLSLMRARYFTVTKDGRRSISRDPYPSGDITNTLSVNRYIYAQNNSGMMDPTGLYSEGIGDSRRIKLENEVQYFQSQANKYTRRANNIGIAEGVFQEVVNGYHIGYDIIGFHPVFGIPADILNGVMYSIEGDKMNAGLSFFSVIPFTDIGTKSYKYIKGANNFFEFAKYSEKVQNQMNITKDIFHSFPQSVDSYANRFGKWTTKLGADGKPYQWLEMQGSYGGYSGTFEYIKDASGVINHRYLNIYK